MLHWHLYNKKINKIKNETFALQFEDNIYKITIKC